MAGSHWATNHHWAPHHWADAHWAAAVEPPVVPEPPAPYHYVRLPRRREAARWQAWVEGEAALALVPAGRVRWVWVRAPWPVGALLQVQVAGLGTWRWRVARRGPGGAVLLVPESEVESQADAEIQDNLLALATMVDLL